MIEDMQFWLQWGLAGVMIAYFIWKEKNYHQRILDALDNNTKAFQEVKEALYYGKER